MPKVSEELPKIIIKRIKLIEEQEVNSIAIENEPYYCYKFLMSPKIIQNKDCIKVKGKSID
jgi:hypothetical protein